MSAVLHEAGHIVAAATTKSGAVAVVSIKEAALAKVRAVEPALRALAERYRDVVYDVSTPKGLAEAKAARHDIRENGRYAVQRAEQGVRDEANAVKKDIAAIVPDLIAIVKPTEDALDTLITAREQEIEAEKERKRQAEAARMQAHRDGIARIRHYAELARQPDMTAERVLKGLSSLEAMTIDPAAWEEFHVEAAHALFETIAAVKVEYVALVAKEAEAARLEQQRIEQEQRQAELDAERRRLEEQAAELKAQQAAMAAQIAATVLVPAAAVLEEAVAVTACTGVAIVTTTVDADGVQATLMDSPWQMPAEIPVGEVVEMAEPAAAPALIDDGREWKLGELTEAFGKGGHKLGLTADLIRELGIEPARVDKRALLFTTSQVLDLQARLATHVLNVNLLEA